MRMFAVSGHVNKPGVYEVEFGVTTFRDLIEAPIYCGGVRGGKQLKAFIPGGASAPWFYEEHLDLPLEKATVDKAGSMLGSGAIVVMDEDTDIVRACHRIVRFFAKESCGKCTPCREGTSWLEKILQRIIDGYGRRKTSTCSSTCATTSAPASTGRRARPRSVRSAFGGVARSPRRRSLPSRVRGVHRRPGRRRRCR